MQAIACKKRAEIGGDCVPGRSVQCRFLKDLRKPDARLGAG